MEENDYQYWREGKFGFAHIKAKLKVLEDKESRSLPWTTDDRNAVENMVYFIEEVLKEKEEKHE